MPTEVEILDCMIRNRVTRAWAVIMLDRTPDPRTPEQLRQDTERMRREAPSGFSGEWATLPGRAWALSLSGLTVMAATQELAERRAAEIERDYDADAGAGNENQDNADDMRYPTW